MTGPKNRRKHFCLTPADRAALEYLARRHQFNRAQAVRHCLRQQVLRDQAAASRSAAPGVPVPGREVYDRIRESACDYYLKGQRYGRGENALTVWGLWVGDDAAEQIKTIQGRWGFQRQADAVRFALRVQAELDGFRPEGGVW